RFHDLRHATATLLLRAGVDPHRVQRILRHTDIRVTLGTYGHLQVEDLRDAVNRIAPQTRDLELNPEAAEPVSVVNLAPRGKFSVQAEKPASQYAMADLENLREIRALPSGRSRFRTCDPCRVKVGLRDFQRAPKLRKLVQVRRNQRNPRAAQRQLRTVSLPRIRGHQRYVGDWIHGTTEEAEVHEAVQ